MVSKKTKRPKFVSYDVPGPDPREYLLSSDDRRRLDAAVEYLEVAKRDGDEVVIGRAKDQLVDAMLGGVSKWRGWVFAYATSEAKFDQEDVPEIERWLRPLGFEGRVTESRLRKFLDRNRILDIPRREGGSRPLIGTDVEWSVRRTRK